MELNLDRKILFNQSSEYKSLYSWFLYEADDKDEKIGCDLIPWRWTLYFSATEISVIDAINIEPDYTRDKTGGEFSSNVSRTIRAKLHPGLTRNKHIGREVAYSMFGTGRKISNFDLRIQILDDTNNKEKCTVWGCPSYTVEVDFRTDRVEDCIIFSLSVQSETFARWSEMICSSRVTEAVLGVGGVAGFYSGWSPSISTDSIKVLADGVDHNVEMMDEASFDLPRLGRVQEADFTLLQRSEMPIPSESHERAFSDSEEETVSGASTAGNDSNQASMILLVKAAKLLGSLRMSAWIIAALLFAIWLKLVL